MKKNAAFLLSALCLGFMFSCNNSGSNGSDSSLSGTINIDGSSTVFPITEAVSEEFANVHPKVKVNIGVSGTGGGFKKFGRGETDISDASRPIKKKEIDLCAKNEVTYVGLAVAYDGLSVVVNKENTWASTITKEELNKIWSPKAEGRITKWSQVRSGWPDEEIHLYGPGTASGTYDYFAEAINGKKVGTRADYNQSEDDNILVQGVANDKYALGFFGLAYYQENADKLQLVAVDGGNGPVKPSLETVANGTYQPLARPIFIYVSNKGATKDYVVEFVDFYLDNAGALSKDVGYIPMPPNKYEEQKQKFASFVRSLKLK